jgi:uncharacterized protein involved in propanediol utilization
MRADDFSSTGPQLTRAGIGHCPLVLGECVQGRTPEGRHFLITSPIGLFSWAEFSLEYEDQEIAVEPSGCWKALAAVEAYLTAHGLPKKGRLRVFTPVGPGQGFGTSTADICASLRAVSAVWNKAISAEEVAHIAIRIEPSDGSMYSGCVAFAHREGTLLERLGCLPRFESVVLCTGGVVDTIEFDARRKTFMYSAEDQAQLMAAWAMVRHANRTRDASLLARASTLSARINEQLLAKPYFEELSGFVEMQGADGIMVAHSGTALALLFDPDRPGCAQRMQDAKLFVSQLAPPAWFEMSNQPFFQRVTFLPLSRMSFQGLAVNTPQHPSVFSPTG